MVLDPIYPTLLVPGIKPTELLFLKVGFFYLRRYSP